MFFSVMVSSVVIVSSVVVYLSDPHLRYCLSSDLCAVVTQSVVAIHFSQKIA